MHSSLQPDEEEERGTAYCPCYSGDSIGRKLSVTWKSLDGSDTWRDDAEDEVWEANREEKIEED